MAIPTTRQGYVDLATRELVSGWAFDGTEPVVLQILDNGVPILRVMANRHRPDLEHAGLGRGRHGFEISFPGGLSPLSRHVIQVRCASDGAELPGSPVIIEAAESFNADLAEAVARAVEATSGADERERVLSFMMTQTDRLLQQRADAEGQRLERQTLRDRRRRGLEAVDPGLRALVIDEAMPNPARDAGSHAILSHMRGLQRLGYAVSFVAAEELGASAAVLSAAGISHCGAPFYASVEDVLRRQAGCFDLVYLHRASMAEQYLALTRKYLPRARVLYSVADLQHVRLERQATVEERPELLARSRRLRLVECTAAWSADAVLTHSTVEVEILHQAVPEAAVYHVPWDVALRAATVPFAGRHGVAFIGFYGHEPNVDAAIWLVEAVMPLVWQVNPAIPCLLVGSAMPEAVRLLARDGVELVGAVDDLGTVFDRVRLTVAPLRYGAGIKGKVLDSLAAGIPCVMTESAAEGLALPPALRALVGHDAAALARLICLLHDDAAAHLRAAEAGSALIRQDFSAELVAAALKAAIEGRVVSNRAVTG